MSATPLQGVVGRQIRLSALDLDESGHWRQLTEIIRALTCLAGTPELLSDFLSATLELLAAGRGHVRMLDRSSGELVVRAQRGFEVLKLAPLTHPLHERARAILDRRLHHTTRLINDLMDVSRLSVGKLELQAEHVTLSRILESAIETVSPVIAELNHELTTALPDTDVTVCADPDRLAQVFVNLLQNAAKYTPRGGTIFLDVHKQTDAVEVAVRDSGIGITAQVLPHVFELFAQAPGAVKHGGGLGIGLALVKGLVEMHGGSVGVHSTGRGQGTTFTVWLPLPGADQKSPPVGGRESC